jgi:hypothetical protein
MAETWIHVLLIINTLACLRNFFRSCRDVYVAGNIFLYYQKGDPKKRRSPDIMVIKGVDGRRIRRSFKTWEHKAVPRTIIEFTSGKTAAEDMIIKKKLYRKLKVREYFLFDPFRDYLPQSLIGYRYSRAGYQPMMPAADGSLTSDELGLRLVPEGDNLALYDLKTGEKLLAPDELSRKFDETRQLLAEVEERSHRAEEELEKERQKAAELEAELKRLRKSEKRRGS